jgi:hypothetical protein
LQLQIARETYQNDSAIKVSMIATSDVHQSLPVQVSCDDVQNVTKIFLGLRSGDYQSTKCGNHLWVSNVCEGSLAICVDCGDPCSETLSYNAPLIYHPCRKVDYWPITVFFSIDVISDFGVPCIISKELVVHDTYADIIVQTSIAGQLFCGIFPKDTKQVSLSGIMSQSYGIVSSPFQSSTISVQGLIPATTYNLFCVAGDLSVKAITVPNNQYVASSATKSVATTTCCVPIIISFDLKEVKVGTKMDTTWSVSLNFKPLVTVPVEIIFSSYTSQNEKFYQSQYTIAFTPLNYGTIQFPWPTMIFTQVGLVRIEAWLNASNGYAIDFVQYGISQDMTINSNLSHSLFVCNTSIVVGQNFTQPKMLYAQYISDGLTVTVGFDAPIDLQNFTVTSFPCNDTLEFVFANVSECQVDRCLHDRYF